MNQADTATALLDAATELFAEHGYAGTSIRMITRAADANLGAVTYHFGTKRELYGAVLRGALAPVAAAVREELSADEAPLDRVDRFVRRLLTFLREEPNTPRLMLHEVAAGRLPPEEGFGVLRETLGRLAQVIEEGQADGTIVQGQPFLQAASVMSQPVYFTLVGRVAASPGAQEHIGSIPLAQAIMDQDAVLEQVTSFVRYGLAKGES